jgi:hypothetical protein
MQNSIYSSTKKADLIHECRCKSILDYHKIGIWYNGCRHTRHVSMHAALRAMREFYKRAPLQNVAKLSHYDPKD